MTASGSASPNAQDAGRPADALHADPRTAPPRAAPLRPGAPPVTLAPGIRVDDCLLPAMSALTVPFALPRAVTAASACALTSTTQGSGPGGGAVVRRDQHLPPAAPSTSAGAAITRSLLLFLGFMFRRPSKIFRPNRLDTWAGLRRLAESADQNLSPAFVRHVLKMKGGPAVLMITLAPPLLINATLGFMLFSSHSLIALWLARLEFFQRTVAVDEDGDGIPDDIDDDDPFSTDFFGSLDGDYGRVLGPLPHEEEITLETVLRGPRQVPKHPTLLSALAGAGAGVIQGVAFTPVENVVRLLHQSAASITTAAARILHLPTTGAGATVSAALGPTPSSPIAALRTFIESSSWNKDAKWWTGWRWAVARDAASYAMFFAAFDLTRRLGLRVKATVAAEPGEAPRPAYPPLPPSETPTRARLAQAGTIVLGGVAAASAANMVGRPFRAAARYSHAAAEQRERLQAAGKPVSRRLRHPITTVWREHGLHGFLAEGGIGIGVGTGEPNHTHRGDVHPHSHGSRALRMVTRAGWRLAAAGPWGFGLLVFAWIGGEV